MSGGRGGRLSQGSGVTRTGHTTTTGQPYLSPVITGITGQEGLSDSHALLHVLLSYYLA